MIRTRPDRRRIPQIATCVLAFALALSVGDGEAQALARPGLDEPARAQSLDPETRVLPVWSNVSGRVEALLLVDPAPGIRSVSPLDRLLSSDTGIPGIGVKMQTGSGATLQSSLRIEPDAGLALLCNGTLGASGALASLTDRCLLATLGHEDPLMRGLAKGAELQFGWQSPDASVDLNFGLSWLHRDADQAVPAAALFPGLMANNGADSTTDIATMNALGFWTSQLDVQSLRVDGLINLGPQAHLLVGGNLGRNRLLAPQAGAYSWDSASVSFGLGYGAFSGMLTGRLIELPGRGNNWTGLDVGLSWRTPWRGELSIGARNVLGSSPAQWPLAELPALEESAERVPYVRYHQDL